MHAPLADGDRYLRSYADFSTQRLALLRKRRFRATSTEDSCAGVLGFATRLAEDGQPLPPPHGRIHRLPSRTICLGTGHTAGMPHRCKASPLRGTVDGCLVRTMPPAHDRRRSVEGQPNRAACLSQWRGTARSWTRELVRSGLRSHASCTIGRAPNGVAPAVLRRWSC